MNKAKVVAKPFLKWAGGKTQLMSEIARHIPFCKNDKFVYVEPFVGSGAVLFWMLNNYPEIRRAVINDINTDLVNCYKTIKSDVDELIKILEKFDKEYNIDEPTTEARKEIYYSKRELFNARTSDIIEQSALFIFLNRTCFNGLFRVNLNNEFNVPQGSYKKPQICNAENLRAVSAQLKKVEILNTDFAETVKGVRGSCFVYLDPPYKPLSVTSNFNSYAQNGFDDSEQKRLKMFCDKLDKKGYKWVLSNSDPKGVDPDNHFFDELYKDYQIERVWATRNINSKGSKRGRLTELLITNVDVNQVPD